MNLETQVRDLLQRALDIHDDEALDLQLARMRGPLRVAIAGRPKTGKSTLRAAMTSTSIGFRFTIDDPAGADAVIYLMRHMHTTDVSFLEACQDQVTGMNTVAVLAHADEIGSGRLDAMISARQIARRYAADPRLRGLCQTVVPVAGLLACSAGDLRQDEFNALVVLAGMPRAEIDARLLSADRLLGLPEASALLDRLGIFGIRLGVTLVRQGFDRPAELAAELRRRSGLNDLQDVLTSHFGARADLLKARSGLIVLDRVLRGRPGSTALLAEAERLLAGAHEFAEVRLLDALRAGRVHVPDGVLPEVERLLGAHGAEAGSRLGLPGDPRAQRAAALATLGDWQRRAESPMSSREFVRAARVIVRTCEGLLAELT